MSAAPRRRWPDPVRTLLTTPASGDLIPWLVMISRLVAAGSLRLSAGSELLEATTRYGQRGTTIALMRENVWIGGAAARSQNGYEEGCTAMA
ncbi:MAG: hypothetical protein JO340_15385 [Acidobacteriaceae bacterium]|nr:hypothetical protein [Acidobacteriaceae bacterium]